jgi:hypothetical protein
VKILVIEIPYLSARLCGRAEMAPDNQLVSVVNLMPHAGDLAPGDAWPSDAACRKLAYSKGQLSRLYAAEAATDTPQELGAK